MKLLKRMRTYKGVALVVAGILGLSLGVASTPVYAADCNAGNVKVKTTFEWNCPGDTREWIPNLLNKIYQWMAAGVGVAVTIGVVYGAIMYASAGGNEAQTKKAVEIIRNAVIALVLFFLMYAILNFLTPGGMF